MLTFRTKCVGLGVISNIGVRDTDNVLPYFKHAATHDMWEVREFAQMYIRKITKINPDKVQEFLLELTKSDNPNHRRFASESLRPVKEIAEELNISLSNSKVRLKRAKDIFKDMLLECCEFELDIYGNIIDYQQKNNYYDC